MLVVDGRELSAAEGVTGAAIFSYWDFSRQPNARMQQHNRVGRFTPGPKATKKTAPFNLLLLQIGPFQHNACVFARIMHSKRIQSMRLSEQIKCAFDLARIWSQRIDPTHSSLTARVEDSFCRSVKSIVSKPTCVRVADDSGQLQQTDTRQLMAYAAMRAKAITTLLRKQHAAATTETESESTPTNSATPMDVEIDEP